MRTVLCLAAGLLVAAGQAAPSARAQVVFEPPVGTAVPVDLVSTSPVLGDLDGDGDLDAVLATGTFNGGDVHVLLNDGTGTLVASPTVAGPAFPGSGVLGDLDLDGHLDFAMIGNGDVIVLPGHGDGTFGLMLAGPAEPNVPTHFRVGLVDGDAIPDVVQVTNGVPPFFSPSMDFFKGTGGFGWSLEWSKPLPALSSDMELADADGDGILDVVLLAAGVASVHPGDGNGAFGDPTPVAGTIAATRATAGDLDADGDVDLVLGASQPQVQTVLNDGLGSFSPAQLFPAGSFGAGAALGDVDGDGVPDVVLNDSGQDFIGQVIVLRGLGGGAFEQDVIVTAGGHPGGGPIEVGDMDGDGLPDAVSGASGVVLTYRNHTYAPRSPFLDLGHALPGTHGYPVQLADGTLLTGEPFAVELLNGLPGGLATIVLGATQADLPFKGGTMVPFPTVLLFGNPMDGDGTAAVAGHWPPGIPSGLSIYLQWWFADGGGVAGRAASSGLRLTAP